MKKKLYLLLIFILFNKFSSLIAKDLNSYHIALIDISDDLRYLKWGIHPVDIRSKFNKEERPLEGAKLAIEESKRFERISNTKFFFEHIRVKNHDEIYNLLESDSIDVFDAILFDIDFKNILKMKSLLNKKIDKIFFNISDPNNDIRKKMCLKNFLNTYPSNTMLTDSIAQYLVKKKWTKTLLLTGPTNEDKNLSISFKNSAKKFGVKIIKEKFFVNSNDPRVRDKNDLSYLTKEKKYNNLFVSDIDGEFSLSIPNATVHPTLVSGASGLIPEAWHWSYLRHGAPQLNGRFERLHSRRMNSKDWSAWIAIKTLIESVIRKKSKNNLELIDFILSKRLELDGSKGISLNYRSVTNQLRQTILLTSSNNWVTSIVPLPEFQNSKNNLDTLGILSDETICNEGI